MGIWGIKQNNKTIDPIHLESMKRMKTININLNEMKIWPIQISMERGVVTKIPEIAEAEIERNKPMAMEKEECGNCRN